MIGELRGEKTLIGQVHVARPEEKLLFDGEFRGVLEGQAISISRRKFLTNKGSVQLVHHSAKVMKW